MPDRETTEAEITVIACLMHCPDTVPAALESLTAESFSVPGHKRIFDAFAVLQATGQKLELPELSKKLGKDDLSYFLSLDAPGSGESIKPAIKILKRESSLKEIAVLSEQVRLAISKGEDPAPLVAELYKKQSAVPDALTIYGVDRLSEPGPVLIFFDKKSADLGHDLINGAVSLACTSNNKKLSKINWSVLSQRKIVIWRGDHIEAGDHLYDLLVKGGAAGVRIVRNPSDVAKGFGIVEAHDHAGWGAQVILAYIKKNQYDPAEETAPPPDDRPPAPDATAPLEIPPPFQFLGYDHNIFYFLPQGSNQVVPLNPGQLNESHCITLAPVNWWETACGGARNGADWKAAANMLVQRQHSKGVYDPSRLRGRGAWEDAGRSVLHLGHMMYVNGKVCRPHEVQSRFIYESAAAMEYNISPEPLKAVEAHKVLDICEMVMWDRPIYGLLLAGWCVIAPICGALNWRPHVHITGKAHSGKTWCIKQIVAPLVGPAALQVVGSSTSAAGIRQALGCDARPVIHDEFDTEKISEKMVNDELELARQCSSETDAVTVKGGADGHVKVYRPRSCFCWASIVTHADMVADLTRVTVLSIAENLLPPDEKRVHFDKLMAAVYETFTEEYCCAFRARNVRLISTIKKNAVTFAKAGALCIGTQRAGDQMGALIAGAYSLSKSGEVSLDEAREWIDARDWSEYRVREDQQDEHRCLAKILQTIIRVQSEKGVNHEMNVGELIYIASSSLTIDGNISQQAADSTLSRHGIRIVPKANAFAVSNNHSAIAKFLEKTSWSKNWAQLLKRLPNTMAGATMRFAGAPPAKNVLIPLDMVQGE